MRRSIPFLAIALSLVAGQLFGQEARRYRLFAGLEPGFSYNESEGFDFESAYVLGVDAYLSPRWALELAAGQRKESFATAISTLELETTSLDVAGRYDLARRGRFTLYGLSGVRYSERRDLRGQVDLEGNVSRFSSSADHTGVLLGFGADFDFTRRFSLQFGAKHIPWSLAGDGGQFEDTAISTALAVRF